MTIFLTLPGIYRHQLIMPDNVTLADFCRRAFERTGLNIFNGFGYLDQAGVAHFVAESPVSNVSEIGDSASPGDITPLSGPYNTRLSSLFQNGDEVKLFATPVGTSKHSFVLNLSESINSFADNIRVPSTYMADSFTVVDAVVSLVGVPKALADPGALMPSFTGDSVSQAGKAGILNETSTVITDPTKDAVVHNP